MWKKHQQIHLKIAIRREIVPCWSGPKVISAGKKWILPNKGVYSDKPWSIEITDWNCSACSMPYYKYCQWIMNKKYSILLHLLFWSQPMASRQNTYQNCLVKNMAVAATGMPILLRFTNLISFCNKKPEDQILTVTMLRLKWEVLKYLTTRFWIWQAMATWFSTTRKD